MIIGIDGSRAFMSKRTGIEEYSYQVIKHLRDKLGNNQVILYLRKNQKIDFDLPANWKIKIINFSYLWTQVGLSLELLFNPVDILFVPAHVVSVIHPKNTIVVIHGLEYEFFPKGYSFWARLYMRWSIRMSCQWAKRIVAVSNNSKKDLMKLYKMPEEKIEVIYEGVSENLKFEILRSKSNPNDQILGYKPYLLFIGRLEKRKNIEGIIESFEILKEKYNIPHKLILAGKFGYGENDIKVKISNSKHKNEIILPGFVKDEDKGEFVKNADIFLFPTFYEGFGLPILEAQKLGVPVVTSDVSSLPEVGGNSVVYADPYDSEKIADAVFRLIDDKNLKDDIVKKGHENIKRFSWEKCASEIVEVLTKKAIS